MNYFFLALVLASCSRTLDFSGETLKGKKGKGLATWHLVSVQEVSGILKFTAKNGQGTSVTSTVTRQDVMDGIRLAIFYDSSFILRWLWPAISVEERVAVEIPTRCCNIHKWLDDENLNVTKNTSR